MPLAEPIWLTAGIAAPAPMPKSQPKSCGGTANAAAAGGTSGCCTPPLPRNASTDESISRTALHRKSQQVVGCNGRL